MTKRFGKPIARAPKEARTYKGILFDSKMEREYAEYLDLMVLAEEYFRWVHQPLIRLGPDEKFSPDFLITAHIEADTIEYDDTWVVDVKGYPQTGWMKKCRLWLKYAPIRMLVVNKIKGQWKTIQIVDPARGTMDKC